MPPNGSRLSRCKLSSNSSDAFREFVETDLDGPRTLATNFARRMKE